MFQALRLPQEGIRWRFEGGLYQSGIGCEDLVELFDQSSFTILVWDGRVWNLDYASMKEGRYGLIRSETLLVGAVLTIWISRLNENLCMMFPVRASLIYYRRAAAHEAFAGIEIRHLALYVQTWRHFIQTTV